MSAAPSMVILLPPPKSLYSCAASAVGVQSSGSGCQNHSCCGISSHCTYMGPSSSSMSIGAVESYWGMSATCSMVMGSPKDGSMVPSASSTGSGLYLRGRPRRRFGLSSPSGGRGCLRGRPRRFLPDCSSGSAVLEDVGFSSGSSTVFAVQVSGRTAGTVSGSTVGTGT